VNANAEKRANEPATESQLAYIRSLGGNLSPSASKLKALELISRLLGHEVKSSPSGCLAIILVGLVACSGITYLAQT
jgi:hypothetical protein